MTSLRFIRAAAVVSAIAVGVFGCSDDSDDDGGVCCPASETRSGCIFEGGYSADGKCPDRAMLCDNLGPYSLGEDEHGCKKWGVGGQ